MHEFLLLALVIIYLVISYVPTSSKDTRQSQRNERSSQGNPEIDGTGSHDFPLGS
jgi:hypothetical protein